MSVSVDVCVGGCVGGGGGLFEGVWMIVHNGEKSKTC